MLSCQSKYCYTFSWVHVQIVSAQIVSAQFVSAQIVSAQFVSGTICIGNKLYREQMVSGTICIGYKLYREHIVSAALKKIIEVKIKLIKCSNVSCVICDGFTRKKSVVEYVRVYSG